MPIKPDYEKSPPPRAKKDNMGASAIICVKIKDYNMKALDKASLAAYTPLQDFLSRVCNEWLENWWDENEDSRR